MEKKIIVIQIFGAHGTGKTEMSKELKNALISHGNFKYGEIAVIHFGEHFRKEIKKKTPRGKRLAPFVQNDEAVPFYFVEDLIYKAIDDPDCLVLILDGCPRNEEHAKKIYSMLTYDIGNEVDVKNVLLTCPDDLLKRRLAERLQLQGRAGDAPVEFEKRMFRFQKRDLRAFDKAKELWGNGFVVNSEDTETAAKKALVEFFSE